MKTSVLFAGALLVCSSALFAAGIDPKLDRAVRNSLPVCGDAKVTYEELPMKLPTGFQGQVVRVESSRHSCGGQYAAVTSPHGGIFLGSPWPLDQEEGATPEAKLKAFAWRAMQLNVDVNIDRTKPTDDGLYRATLVQLTENGKLPIEGAIDRDGKIFFMGPFRRMNGELRAQRGKVFESYFGVLPARGPASAPVTIVEFSDFECPSCKRSSGYGETIVAKHGDKVRYVRFDLPLVGHPWAFPAALAGRAIHRQKPELFWEYKKQVYANQSELNAFMFWDWARGFASDHGLDLKKYDADLANEEIKASILRGAGAAFSNDVRATPTYIVNGVIVDAGDNGAALMEYVDMLVTQPATPGPEKPSASAQ